MMKIWNIMKHDWILSDLLTHTFILSPAFPKSSLLLISAVLTSDEERHHHLHFLFLFQKGIDSHNPFLKNDSY